MPTVQVTGPSAPSGTAAESNLLPASAVRQRWFYAHFPPSWEFHPTAGFLPILVEQYAVAGVNGVREVADSNGRVVGVNDSAMRAGLTGKGAIILDPADHRLGPWKNYCRPYPCVGGGKCWIFYVDKGGVTFDVLPNGVAVTREASGLLREFRIWLLAQGIIPPMPLPVYQMLIERERTALHRSIRDATGNPHLGAKVDARQARIDQMEKAWSSMIDQMSVNPASPLTRLSAPGLV